VYPILETAPTVVFGHKECQQIPMSNMGSILRINGCNYKLSEKQICCWIEHYGEILGDLEEEAMIDEADGYSMGTLAYLAMVRLARRVTNMIPMFGQKVTVSQDGSSRTCKNGFGCHKNDHKCEQKSSQGHVDQFKSENPRVPSIMFDNDQDEEFSNEVLHNPEGFEAPSLNDCNEESSTFEETCAGKRPPAGEGSTVDLDDTESDLFESSISSKNKFALNKLSQAEKLSALELEVIEKIKNLPNEGRLVCLAKYQLDTALDLFQSPV
jgi:hypothetical protein